jgi:hypothetical protein
VLLAWLRAFGDSAQPSSLTIIRDILHRRFGTRIAWEHCGQTHDKAVGQNARSLSPCSEYNASR